MSVREPLGSTNPRDNVTFRDLRGARRVGRVVARTLMFLVVARARAAHAEQTPETFRVSLEETKSWAAGGAEAPDLSRSSPRATLAFFEARTSADGARAVAACTTIEISGWLDEVRPIAEDRLEGLAAGTFVKAMGRAPKWTRPPPTTTDPRAGVSRIELVPSGASAEHGASGALFLGFSGGSSPKVVACFAMCAPRDEDGPSCHGERANFEGPFVAPPPPTLLLRALAAAVHHPREASAGGAAIVLALAALYVRSRPRPRIRGSGPRK
jgi:hypothetical protein